MSPISLLPSPPTLMDGHGSSDLSSFLIPQHHHLLPDSASADAAAAGKMMFSHPPNSPAGDANPFAISHAVTTRASPACLSPEPVKRKRGRPRKYGALPSSRLLTLPISAASTASKPSPLLLHSSPDSSSRKKEASAASSSMRKAKFAALGSAGEEFTPHVFTFSAGEDVVYKLMCMMQQLKRAICVLTATGSIVNPSLCQSGSSSSITYEGKFEIISLSGSLLYTKACDPLRTGKLVICLSGMDGRIVGGGVEGSLIAAGPVQMIAGSFLIDTALDASKNLDDNRTNTSITIDSGATLTSPVSMESTYVSSGRIASSTGRDEPQNMVGSSYLFHPRPMLSTIEWEGRQISGLGRICRSLNDEEDFGD
ncbi:hypothetical protein HPP92_020243 [Vanilla planifolia]|uniref:AT-hook motif nuclear-localized protein n=1 Tax=Vanilla planifolia TaxID=51239 RepID=A0A835Q6V5_VANPL|nr:hypothetical protein HPP92_020243 [Vanilla planifolia]